VCIATDINQRAAQCSLATSLRNAQPVSPDRRPPLTAEVVQTRFLRGLHQRLAKSVDILLFNPPYVVTSSEELHKAQVDGGVEASWAGGVDGREVIDAFLPLVDVRWP
jgi:release factor glutamine methyltransferase